MAEDCADDDDDRATIAALRKAILQELSLHASVLEVPLFLPHPPTNPLFSLPYFSDGIAAMDLFRKLLATLKKLICSISILINYPYTSFNFDTNNSKLGSAFLSVTLFLCCCLQ